MYYPVSSILIEFLILSIVKKQDSYGYEISQTIKIVADIKESTLYPILKKLEKAGFVTTYTQEFQGEKTKILHHYSEWSEIISHSSRQNGMPTKQI